MNKIRAGIIGIGGYGAALLDELAKNDLFEVKAIADRDRERAEQAAQKYSAQAYDDYRSLIVQEKLDVLFLALPTYLCGECVNLAAKAGLHVFKEPPLARNLPEALQWVETLEKAGRWFQVAAPKRFSPGYLKMHQLLTKGRIGEVYLVRAEGFWPFEGDFEWRGDPVLAGGGVLLEMGYHLIDQIVWDLAPPERVFCLSSNWCGKQVLPPYRTEDTVVLSMSFTNGAIGNLLCSWATGPTSERLLMHGTNGSIETDGRRIRVYDIKGQVVQEEDYDVDLGWRIAQQIRQFGDSLLNPDIKPVSTAREHLVNVAIAESAYLSARTQLPEALNLYRTVL